LGAPLGALVGFGLGRSLQSESTRWDPVFESSGRARVGFLPIIGGRRTGVGVWIAF
jgi:hypothetical protein